MNWRCVGFALSLVATASMTDASERLVLTVTEPAGIHRDAAPVHARLELPRPVAVGTKFRLVGGGKSVAAQFRPYGKSDTADWWLDFVGRSAPFEKRRYVIEYGDDVTPSPEPSRGHRLIQRDDDFVISNAPHIDWTVPSQLRTVGASAFGLGRFHRSRS
ncbi:MAG: hypothetical protein ACYTGL_28590 [Planctomycetota bacterium]